MADEAISDGERLMFDHKQAMQSLEITLQATHAQELEQERNSIQQERELVCDEDF